MMADESQRLTRSTLLQPRPRRFAAIPTPLGEVWLQTPTNGELAETRELAIIGQQQQADDLLVARMLVTGPEGERMLSDAEARDGSMREIDGPTMRAILYGARIFSGGSQQQMDAIENAVKNSESSRSSDSG